MLLNFGGFLFQFLKGYKFGKGNIKRGFDYNEAVAVGAQNYHSQQFQCNMLVT